jgi:hypothetical protein
MSEEALANIEDVIKNGLIEKYKHLEVLGAEKIQSLEKFKDPALLLQNEEKKTKLESLVKLPQSESGE